MFTERVLAGGNSNSYDTILQKIPGNDPRQNAWLVVELKVALNFVDSANQVAGLTVQQGGQWFALDSDNWMFPMAGWTEPARKQFRQGFKRVAESTWHYKFLLITPRDYAELDFPDHRGGWMVRPNVICGFRLHLVGPGSTVETGKTISGNLNPHQTINVVRLSDGTTTVRRTFIPTLDTDRRFSKPVGPMDGGSFRSNSGMYDEYDLNKPTHNTIGHEVGHSLGQGHIRCITNPLPICSTNPNASATYGTNASDSNDGGNIMGSGNDLTLINAEPWTQRIMRHTYRAFPPSQAVNTPPRLLSLNDSYMSKSNF